MNNIMISVKRFFKNKNTVTILAIIAALGILYWAYDYRIKSKTQPVNVPYATKMIGPREVITPEMVSVKKVPAAVAVEGVLTNRNKIIGKYVSNKAVIPEGSLFYDKMLVDWDKLPSSLYENIEASDTVIYLPVNLATTYGNSIYPGNYIDLYFKDNKRVGTGASTGTKLYLGKFIESIKVLAVVDKDGNDVFETAGDPLDPAYLMFSVSDEAPTYYYTTIKKALAKNSVIFPVPRDAEYSNKEKAKPTRYATQAIVDFINEKTVSQDVVVGGKND